MAKKKHRKLTRAEARAEAERRQRRRRITWAVVGVVLVAVVAVLVLIAVSGNGDTAVADAEPLQEDVNTGVTEEGYPYRGDPDAPVTLVEYSDYNCPYCQVFALETAPKLDEELVATGQVKYVVQPYALWEGSVPIVEAAVCATEQDKFWDFHHRIFTEQSRFSTERPPSPAMLRDWASASGLDEDAFAVCLNEGRENQVLAATQHAKTELGVNSTPTFFINGERVQLLRDEEPIDTIRRVVNTALTTAPAGQE
jgi:protein-disulfide isomerase